MTKIEQIKLTNFRAFEDKFNTVDFNNKDGMPADFICIYGQNGMGKTSFFDGVEWFSTGKLYRFEENDINKEIKKYKGYILSNRKIENNNVKSYVEVKYSNKSISKRTVRRAKKDIEEKGYRDYNRGKLSGNNINKIYIDEKQILAHDKIDSFVFAKTPSQKYEDWGNFWDSDKSQRMFFAKIYSIKKLITKRIETIEKLINEASCELEKLLLSDEKIEEINNKIEDFNKIEQVSEIKLSKLMKSRNKILNILDSKEIIQYKNTFNKVIDKEDLIKEKVLYLIKFYNKYYTDKRNNIEYKMKKIKVEVDEYEDLDKAGILWFEEYKEWKKTESNIELNNNQIKIKQQTFKLKNNKLTEVNEVIKILIDKIKNIEDEEENILYKTRVIEEKIKELSNKQSKYRENLYYLEKIKTLKQKNQDIMSNLEEAKIKDENNDFDIYIMSISEYDEKFLDLRKRYIMEYKKITEQINEKSQEVIKNKKIYDLFKKNFDELEKILIEGKGYIDKEKLSACPVCHTPFDDVGILLGKINLNEQSKHCKRLYDKYKLSLEAEQAELKKKKILIINWNEECEDYKISLGKQNSDYASEFAQITHESKKIKKEIEHEEQNIKIFKEELNEIDKYEGVISETLIKEWLNIIKDKYKNELGIKIKEMNEISKAVRKLEKDIENFKNIIDELESRSDNFYKNEYNKVLLNKVNQINNKKNNKIMEWSYFKSYYELLKKQIIKFEKENTIISDYLIGYEKYENDSQCGQENFTYIESTYSDYMLQIFNNNYIKFNELKNYIINKDKIIKDIKVKVDILDYLNNELCNSDYNIKYNELNELIKMKKIKLKKYELSKNKIDKIFINLKKYIEENIENVLGSKSMNQIYSIIEPNKEFSRLKIEVGFSNKGKNQEEDIPELYLKTYGENNQTILPEYFFSTAQLNTVALSIFLGQALSMDLKVKTIFIDDPVGHFDDINVLAFVDLLRNIIVDGKWQIVISTHDESFFNLLKNKISDDYYNSKFITFSSIGKLSYR
ncbi:TPA: AAA family ATPase [Clostridium perfringens]|nr:AAA family ATPase [Clostridium perfringens]